MSSHPTPAFDHGILNVPLHLRGAGSIEAQLTRNVLAVAGGAA